MVAVVELYGTCSCAVLTTCSEKFWRQSDSTAAMLLAANCTVLQVLWMLSVCCLFAQHSKFLRESQANSRRGQRNDLLPRGGAAPLPAVLSNGLIFCSFLPTSE